MLFLFLFKNELDPFIFVNNLHMDFFIAIKIVRTNYLKLKLLLNFELIKITEALIFLVIH